MCLPLSSLVTQQQQCLLTETLLTDSIIRVWPPTATKRLLATVSTTPPFTSTGAPATGPPTALSPSSTSNTTVPPSVPHTTPAAVVLPFVVEFMMQGTVEVE